MRSCVVVAGILVVLVFGCQDRAKTDFDKCLALAMRGHEGDLQDAVGACNAAVKVDPNSASGKAAVAKLADLQPKYDEWKKADDARLAALAEVEAGAKRAAQQREAETRQA